MSKQRVPTSQVLSGKLSGNPNLIYDIIDNNDVVKAPYMDRIDNGDFALYKRKAYKNILANEDYIDWNFNDALKVRYGECGSEGLTTYVQATDAAGTAGQILKYFEGQDGTINCLSGLVGDELCICDCQTNRLVPSMGPRGEIKTLPGAVTVSALGVQDSATVGGILRGRFWIETSAGSGVHEDLTAYSSGSFRYIYAMCAGGASTDGIGGQIRKIVGYESTDKERILDAPRTLGTVITDRKNVTFSVFADRGELINYVDCDGISTIHPDGAGYNVTYACNSEQSGDACIKAMEYYDSRIWFINTEGSLAYGGTGYDAYYFTADQSVPVQQQTMALSAFQNHLIFMGYDFMGAVYKKEFYGLTGYNAFSLSDKVGLRSRESYLSDDDAFYIVTNDKQLKVVSITSSSTGTGAGIQFQDVIDVFDGELGRLQKGDEVYINKVGTELRIHIVTQAISQDGITEGSGTKILIYDTRAKLYHTHTVCDQKVTRYENDLYLGSGVFRRCGYEDGGYPDGDGLTTGTVFYDQLISAFIGSNKNNGLTFDVFNPKIINLVKTDIGPSIITSGNTSLKYIEHRMGYKSQYVIDDRTTVPWIANMNTIAAGDNVAVDECMLNDMQDCQSITNLCEDGVTQVALPSSCNCSGEYYLPRDYCVCFEDTSYMLSMTYPIVSKFRTKKFDVAKLERRASEGDRLYFQGFVAEIEVGQAIDNYTHDNVIEQQECCTRTAYVAPVTNLTAVAANGECGDITLSRTASVTSGVTYTIREGTTTLFSGIAGVTKNIGTSVGAHTYKVYAVKNGSESVMATVEITTIACSIVMTITSAAAFGGNPYNVLVTGGMDLNGLTVTEKGIVYYETGNPGTEIGDAGVTKVIASPTLPEGAYTVLNVGMTHNKSFVFKTYCIDSGAVEHYSPTTVTYVTPV